MLMQCPGGYSRLIIQKYYHDEDCLVKSNLKCLFTYFIFKILVKFGRIRHKENIIVVLVILMRKIMQLYRKFTT